MEEEEKYEDKFLQPGMESNTVILISSDNITREVDPDILKKAKLFEDWRGGDKIPLNDIDSKNLDLIIKYFEHYKDKEPKEIPKPFPENTDDAFFRGILNDDWTFNYLNNLSVADAVNLTNAANYLMIDGLINILAAKLAYEMINCDIEEARQKFGIEADLTEEEIAEIDKYPLD